MKNNEVLIFITLFFIMIVLFNTIFLISKTNELMEQGKVTGKGVGVIRLCINHKPSINISLCGNKTYAENLYSCKVNATDEDYAQTLIFNSSFISGNRLFNISPSGQISFAPQNREEGDYTVYVNVTDRSGCNNHYDSATFDLQIVCNNTKPRLNLSICSNVAYQNITYTCQLNATDPDIKGKLVFSYEFIYNSGLFAMNSSGFINFTPNQTHVDAGYYQINIAVNDSRNCSNSTDSGILNITVYNTNDPPVFNGPIANQSWEQDTVLVAFDLDTYFSDPDGDPLTYTHSIQNNIDVEKDEYNIITFTPIPGWYGTEYITFFAHDPAGANASSNDIMLTVYPKGTPQVTPTAGGGGGAGGYIKCVPEWYCSDWRECLPEGYQIRECIDLHNCGSLLSRPNVTQACNYIATCYDNIQNNGEEGIDCGGPCKPCPSCNDGIKNQGELGIDCGGPCKPCPGCQNNIKDAFEEGVDCGGPCPPCPSCNDGIKNCHKIIQTDGSIKEVCEMGVDCGGPCSPCLEVEVPGYLQERNRILTLTMIIAIVVISIFLITYRFTHEFVKKTVAKIGFYIATKEKRKEEAALLALSFADRIIEKLNRLEEKISSKEITKELSIEFSKIVREYFKDILNLDYEFTYEELLNELKQKRLDPALEKILLPFFKKAIQAEFGGYKLRRGELHALINEAKEIVHLTSKEEPKERLRLENIPKEGKDIDKVYAAISNVEKLLESNHIESAMKLYLSTLDVYNKLPEKEKDEVYITLTRLYDELRLAAERR